MTRLTDLQVLALLAAAPVDHNDDVRGHIKPGHISATEFRWLPGDRFPRDVARKAPQMRKILARVFGLPERDGSEFIVMTLAWESDAKETP